MIFVAFGAYTSRLSGVDCVKPMLRSIILAPIFAAALFAHGVVATDAGEARLEIKDNNLHAEVVAAPPLIETARAFTFDERRRLFVAEANQISLLSDDDGDGRMDRRVVFAEGLGEPNGLLPWRGGLIVTCAPDVLFLRDKDGDGRADERRVLLTGFETTSGKERVNAPALGPDGWIYLGSGWRQGEISSPQHPERKSLKLTSDIRFQPETLEVERVIGLFGSGGEFDDFGRQFINSPFGPMHVIGPALWLRLPNGIGVQNLEDLLLHPAASLMRQLLVWRGGSVPSLNPSALLWCTQKGVQALHLEPRGATFKVTSENQTWITAKQGEVVALGAGPDGGLYVAENSAAEKTARIWMVIGDKRANASSMKSQSEQVKMLSSENGWARATAFRLLCEKPAPAETLKAAFSGNTPAAQAAILHLLAQQSTLDSESYQAAANSSDARVREVGLMLWRAHHKPGGWMPDPSVLGNEPDPRTRFVAALALADISEGVPALAAIAARDAGDPWTRAAVLSGIAGREGEFLAAFVEAMKQVGPGEAEILRAVGRSLPDASSKR